MPQRQPLPTRWRWLPLCAMAWGSALCLVPATGRGDSAPASVPLTRHEEAAIHMGAEFRLIFYGEESPLATSVSKDVFQRMAELDERLSDYKDESELNLLCRSPVGEEVLLGDDLFRVLRQSQEIARHSNGAFDVTAGPMIRLWRRARRTRDIPTPERIAETRPRVGYEHLDLDESKRTARLDVAGMQLDLGGIAKGYATSQALAILRARGFPRALVIGGGEIAAGEPPPGKEGWRIAVLTPGETEKLQEEYLLVKGGYVSTSGDASQFLEVEGKRYSHLVDPRTGQALTTRRQVTVVATDGMTADGLASALSLLGPENAAALLRHYPQTEARIDEYNEKVWKTWTTEGWSRIPKEPRQPTPSDGSP